mmetsp:Transcript_33398/g.99469  ORF Transcript_33398/g.99469 Transcript_33398/m.99469 type:complete len:242 (+) Transcript_33398:442-1167(+)
MCGSSSSLIRRFPDGTLPRGTANGSSLLTSSSLGTPGAKLCWAALPSMCNRSCVHSGRSATLTRRKRLNMALRSQRSRSATGSSGPPTPVLREGSEAPETAAAAAVSSSTPPAPARSLPLLFSSAPAEQPAYESLSAVLACAACCSCGALRPPAACMLSMSSSMVPSIASISTVTSLVAPMRCARLTICSSKLRSSKGSSKNTWLTNDRSSPTAPTVSIMSTPMEGSLTKRSITSSCSPRL